MWSFILVIVMFCAIEGQDTLRRAPNELTAESSVLEMELNAAASSKRSMVPTEKPTAAPKTAVYICVYMYDIFMYLFLYI
jgi:hypothetical protein